MPFVANHGSMGIVAEENGGDYAVFRKNRVSATPSLGLY